jgi:arginyl-tRNA synthetase
MINNILDTIFFVTIGQSIKFEDKNLGFCSTNFQIIKDSKINQEFDYNSNLILRKGKDLGLSFNNDKEKFQELANLIIEKLKSNSFLQKICSNIEYKNGFINVKLSNPFINLILEFILKNPLYGKSEYENQFIENLLLIDENAPKYLKISEKEIKHWSRIENKKKVNIEWVSANPTGPFHIGHSRQIVVGKLLSTLFEWSGWDVTREYYLNNVGNQIQKLVQSVQAIQHGLPIPEDGYHGDYIKRMAALNVYDERSIINWCLEEIYISLNKFKIKYDIIFEESQLNIDVPLIIAENLGITFEKDDATWIKFKDREKVIVKSDGTHTYRWSDIIYHINKLSRGYDLVIDIFGSDHYHTAQDVKEGLELMGTDTSKLKIILNQMVIFLNDENEKYKPSKRQGNAVELNDLIDEIGIDNLIFFFSLKEPNQHIQIDLKEIKDQTLNNRLVYLKYTHARLFSLLEKCGMEFSEDITHDIDLNSQERSLAIKLIQFPEIIKDATDNLLPNKIPLYGIELAKMINNFYQNNKVADIEDYNRSEYRLALSHTSLLILKNVFSILGIDPPNEVYFEKQTSDVA